MLALLAYGIILPSPYVLPALTERSESDLSRWTRLLLPAEKAVRHRGPVPGAEKPVLEWAKRMLKPAFSPPPDVRLGGTVYQEEDTIEYGGEDRNSVWRYVDVSDSSLLFLESKRDEPALSAESEALEHMKRVVETAISTPHPAAFPPRIGARSVPLPSGRLLWKGGLFLDTEFRGDDILNRPAFWRYFRFWTDGKQTMLVVQHVDSRDPLPDPAMLSPTLPKGPFPKIPRLEVIRE